MTAMTMRMASMRVLMTSWMEAPTMVVVSKATAYFMPGGKDWERSLEFGFGVPVHLQSVGVTQLHHAKTDGGNAVEGQGAGIARRPSSARPTSLIWTMPLGVFLTTMLSNCSGVVRRPTTLTEI